MTGISPDAMKERLKEDIAHLELISEDDPDERAKDHIAVEWCIHCNRVMEDLRILLKAMSTTS